MTGDQGHRASDTQGVWIAHLIPAAMCAAALADMPYGFYTLLRLVVTVCAVLSAHWLGPGRVLFWVMAFIALLFNPIIPVYLSRAWWGVIDLAVAGVFVASAYRITQMKTGEQ